jgi:hypothetical protein
MAAQRNDKKLSGLGLIRVLDKIKALTSLTNFYNKTETNSLLSNKANSADVYTKTQVDTSLNAKADAASVYSKSELDGVLLASLGLVIHDGALYIAPVEEEEGE